MTTQTAGAAVPAPRMTLDSCGPVPQTADVNSRFERQQAADRTRVSLELEQMQMSDQALQIQQEWIEGRISDEQMHAQILALHTRG